MDSMFTGFPELDVPSLDPLIVPETLLDYKQDAAEGKMIVRDSTVYGLKDVDILDFRSVSVALRVACSSYTETTERNAMGGGDVSAQGSPLSSYCHSNIHPSLVAYVNQPKSRVTSEGYHYQHSCEQNQ
jgi:hypothetical protein